MLDLPPMTRGCAYRMHGRRGVDAAIRRGDLVVVRRGVLAGIRWLGHPHLAARVQMARLQCDSVASHGTAADLWQLSRLGRASERVRLTKATGSPWRDAEVSVAVADLPGTHVTTVGDVPVTTPARTVVDLARRASFVSGVVLADSALRAGTDRTDLGAILRDCHGWPGIQLATAVVSFADPRAESPLESVSRVRMHEHGLPAPRLQVWVDDSDGPIGRCDFYWDGVIGEADGMNKYTAISVLHAEKLRQERLERAGYRVVRWTWREIWYQPAAVCERIRWALDHPRS